MVSNVTRDFPIRTTPSWPVVSGAVSGSMDNFIFIVLNRITWGGHWLDSGKGREKITPSRHDHFGYADRRRLEHSRRAHKKSPLPVRSAIGIGISFPLHIDINCKSYQSP